MKLLATAVAALALTGVVAPAAQATTSRMVTIDYVVDGDTVRLTDGRYVRLIGYDTPERGHRYYKAATNLMVRLVSRTGYRVRIVRPTGHENTDYYGRLLRYIRIGPSRIDVGKREIRHGYGHARYDSLDGYQWHPLQATYHRIDRNTPNLWPVP